MPFFNRLNNKKFKLRVIGFILLLIGFLYGFSVRVFKIFPYSQLEKVYYYITYDKKYDPDSLHVSVEDISELMRVTDLNKIEHHRHQLKEIVLKGKHMDELNANNITQVDSFSYLLSDEHFLYECSHEMEFNIQSTAHLIIPRRDSFDFLIFHMGHNDSFLNYTDLIEPIIDAGFGMALLDMPLEGINNQPVVFHKSFGEFVLDNHDKLALLENDSSPHYLNVFIEPVLNILNFVSSEFNIGKMAMMGLSGGGWTTQLSAAIDSRITHSFSIAGSVPMFLRMPFPENYGDYEQVHPALFQHFGYMDLYVLGAHNRFQKQYFNYYDPCCFGGDLTLIYEPIIKDVLGESGSFSVEIDYNSFKHDVSSEIIEDVLFTLNKTN